MTTNGERVVMSRKSSSGFIAARSFHYPSDIYGVLSFPQTGGRMKYAVDKGRWILFDPKTEWAVVYESVDDSGIGHEVNWIMHDGTPAGITSAVYQGLKIRRDVTSSRALAGRSSDKRRGRGRRKFVQRPSDEHPFDNEPFDSLDTIEDRYGSFVTLASGRRVKANYIIVENESGHGDWIARGQFGGHTYQLSYLGGGPVEEPEVDFQHFHSYVITCDGVEVAWPSSTASDAYYDAFASFSYYLRDVWRGANPFRGFE